MDAASQTKPRAWRQGKTATSDVAPQNVYRVDGVDVAQETERN